MPTFNGFKKRERACQQYTRAKILKFRGQFIIITFAFIQPCFFRIPPLTE